MKYRLLVLPLLLMAAYGLAIAPAPALARSAASPTKSAGARTPPAPTPAAVPAETQSRCNEDDAAPSARSGRDASMLEPASGEPRDQLQELVRLALQQSRTIGAARLLTQAAEADLEETKAGVLPSVSLGGSVGPYLSEIQSQAQPKTIQAKASFSLSAPLFDAGRIRQLTEWRGQLAESARLGQSYAEEQLALQTVSLALEHGRYVLQGQIYRQYGRKMACLVDALATIVKADKGRASELVQAQKSLQQADLSYETTMAALRTTETRLRRLVGDQLPPLSTMSTVLAVIPGLEDSLSDIQQSSDILQATAQARAQDRYAEAVVAAQKPQVSWVVTAGVEARSNNGNQPAFGRDSELMGGISVNIPLFQPGSQSAASAAYKRALAAQLQRDEALETKRYRMIEMHETAMAAMDRARRIVDLLRNSDRVRASTLQQWQQLGRRSLFDVMSAEGDYYSMRIAHVNTLYDVQQVVALMWSMGRGVMAPLR